MSRARQVTTGLALACHPGPTLVVTALAGALALGTGSPARTVALVTTAVLAGQLSVGWSNDWIDAERDVAVARAGKPVVSGLLDAATLRGWAFGAVAVCVVLSFACGPVAGSAHVAAVASAWAYNGVLKRTVVSWLPYAVSFALLVVFVVHSAPGGPWPAWWAVAAAALLGVGAHVANVLPDLEDDSATGVHGLPHRLGRTWATAAALGTLLAGVAVVVLAPAGPPGTGAWVGAAGAVVLTVVGGVVAHTDRTSRLPFAMSMAVAVVCVVLLVAAGGDLVAGAPAVARDGT